MFMEQLLDLVSAKYERLKERLSLNLDKLSNYPLLEEHLTSINLDYTFPDKNILWWHSSLKADTVKDPLEALKKLSVTKMKK